MKNFNLTLILIFVGFSTYAKQPPETIVINLTVTEKGFEPNKIDVAPETPVKLNIVRKTNDTCSTSIQIPSLKIKKDLPLQKTVSIELGKLTKGEIRFGCGMNMMDGGMIYVK